MEKQKTFEKVFKEHLKVETYSKSIESLYSRRSVTKINYKPYYQRNYVWDNSKATYFIESILLGTEIPPLIFFDNNNNIEIIDGRQRFETILRFMNNEFSLTKRGLNALKQLKGSSWDSLSKKEPEIIESFLDAKLRIIEFKLVNEPPLDKVLEDQIKKEIFSRYNSGITPLKKVEVDNAIYDDDELTNSFKHYFEKNPDVKMIVYKTFFKQLKKDSNNPPIENILSFVRRFLILPSFPINYFASGTSRTDILTKLYEYFADENISNHDNIINSFSEKAYFMSEVKEFSEKNNLNINRLALECFLWGLGVLDIEEIDYSLNDKLLQSISFYVDENIVDYGEEDFAFSKEVMKRFSSTSKFFENYFNVDLSIYINADQEAKARINDAKRHDDAVTKLTELESLRLNKPEPSKSSIDDIGRMLTRRRFMIRPSYQRKEVINPKKASSIIESILLGITLPAIFVYKRSDGIHEVIDGQQRLLTFLAFTETGYVNEKGQSTYSKNHKFRLRNLRILKELDGMKFSDLSQDDQDKIFDFQLYVVEIDQKHNLKFNPVDLFIRLNDKPYPIRENSFEMWNSWADIDIIENVKNLKKELQEWFFVKQIKKNTDRDRMENEELVMTLAFLEYNKKTDTSSKVLDVYQKTDRLNARISTKAKMTSLMQKVLEDEAKKDLFLDSIKDVKSFSKKLKYVLLDDDKFKDEINEYLKDELDDIFKAERERRSFRRTIQDFYFIWLFLESLNLEMIKYNRIEIKKIIKEAFKYFKNIPEDEQLDNIGYNNFMTFLNEFKEKFKRDKRKINLNEKDILNLIKAQNRKSSLSDAKIFLGDDLEVDHNKPIATGGKDEVDNLGIAHKDENRSKGAKNNN